MPKLDRTDHNKKHSSTAKSGAQSSNKVVDVEQLAQKVFDLLKSELRIEQERLGKPGHW